jgi:site-specific DNA-methyltransferase (cytosine-N4-specific)
MSAVLLCQGEARRLPLRDASVHCVVTSPPYYGLRDYGTGQWVGGDAGCTHREDDRRNTRQLGTFHGGDDTAQTHVYRGTCPRCGAVRVDAQIGLEPLHDCLAWARQEPPCAACWVCAMRAVFAEVWRILVPTGTLWINVGDTYSGYHGNSRVPDDQAPSNKPGYIENMRQSTAGVGGTPAKNLFGMPWRLALALQADGFILRSDCIWEKPSCMPESVTDRFTRSHEYVFLFAKQARYYFDQIAIREEQRCTYTSYLAKRGTNAKYEEYGTAANHLSRDSYNPAGRNARSVWSIASEPLSMSHYAAFPTALVRRCLLAGAPRMVCAVCRKPHVRQVEHQRFLDGHIPVSGTFSRPDEPFRIPPNGVGHYRYSTQTTDHGFSPTCACNAPTRPGLVLDPFCGSGTTLLVARELGLDAVGVDLSWEYVSTIARERLGLTALQAWQEGSDARAERFDDLPLFAP